MNQAGDSPLLRIFVLGGFRVEVGDQRLDASVLRLRAAQQLLKLLALAPDHRLHREQVLDLLWPDQAPRAAVNSLNQALYVARQALGSPGAPYLILRDQTLRLGDPVTVWVDALAFDTAARQARHEHNLAAALAALALYRSDLLPDDPYDSWLEARRLALRGVFRALLLELATWGDEVSFVVVRDGLQQALAGDPADEELHRALMRLYARAGDRLAALRQYELLERALRHDLALAPDELSQQLRRAILAERAAAPAQPFPAPLQNDAAPSEHSVAAPNPHLPLPLTSFVGRAAELAELLQLLGTTRLLTIAGAGGSGKTRVALELARAAASAYRDGACFVELAALADPSLLTQVVGAAFGLRETQGVLPLEQLVAVLAERQLLLVLDNCEHLLHASAALAELLLQRCPGLRILVTSREPLHIGGELTWLIPALALPDPRQPLPTPGEIRRFAALQLFVERATAAQARFTLRDDDVAALVQICARLDGLPLPIELAAARVTVLSLAQIAARLDDRFRLLSAGSRTALTRQQTLRAAIDWSYNLLSDAERQLFRRLAVFAGGWTLEAAEAVCAGEGLATDGVLLLLAQLVNKSLVTVRDQHGAKRYDLLETMRQYGLEQLQAAGEETLLRGRHQEWCLELAAQGERELTGPRQVAWLGLLAAELDNLRLALQWTPTPGPDEEPRLWLAYRLFWFWYLHSAVSEGRAAFERVLAETAPDEQSWRRGVALLGTGSMALYQGELRIARARLEASMPMLRATGDPFSQALAPFLAGTVAVNQGEYAPARAWLEESVPRFEALGHYQGVATALLHLGDVAFGQGELDEAEAHYTRCLAIHRGATGSTWGIAQAQNNLGEVARYRGDLAGAAARYAAALALFEQLATKADVARTRHNQAALALAAGDLETAAASFQASLELFRAWGNCRGMVECVAGLAQVAATGATSAEGWERVAALLGFVEAYFAQSGAALWPPDRQNVERAQAAFATRLPAAQLADAQVRGQSLTLAQAVHAALEPH